MSASGFTVIAAIQSTGKIASAAHAIASAVNRTGRLERTELPPRDLVEPVGEHEEHDPDHHRGRGGGAQVPEVEDGLVDEEARGFGGGAGPAPREQEDRVEDLERVDEPQQPDDRHEGGPEGAGRAPG